MLGLVLVHKRVMMTLCGWFLFTHIFDMNSSLQRKASCGTDLSNNKVFHLNLLSLVCFCLFPWCNELQWRCESMWRTHFSMSCDGDNDDVLTRVSPSRRYAPRQQSVKRWPRRVRQNYYVYCAKICKRPAALFTISFIIIKCAITERASNQFHRLEP